MPLASNVGLCDAWGALRRPVTPQLPVAGLCCSALAAGLPLISVPAATSTMPLVSNVALCKSRAVLRLPVKVQVPLSGSYSSALAIGGEGKVISSPAATSTFPSGNNVAVFADRPLFRLPVRVQLPLTGSYSSALARMPLLVLPPATTTMPLDSNVELRTVRAVFKLPVKVQLPLTGSYSSALASTWVMLSHPS